MSTKKPLDAKGSQLPKCTEFWNWTQTLPVPKLIVAVAVATLIARQADAQSPTNLNVLRGLAPISELETTIAGKAALAANLSVTAAIQDGSVKQPLLLPFPEQQQQALRDAYITDGNAYQLADGLGSELGGIYWSLTTFKSADDGKTSSFTSLSSAVARLIAYTNATTRSDSNSAKYLFGNATVDNKAPVSAEALAILTGVKGHTDIFGRAYGHLAGSAGADAYGNSRPFQTEPHLTSFAGMDFFGVQSGNLDFLRGPSQDLTNSPSFPSGHTTYGYVESLLLALLVPQRYLEMITRAAEYGNNRIILGAHYAIDVLGGRTLSTYDLAQLLANKSQYVGVKRGDVSIEDYQQAFAAARSDIAAALEKACGDKIDVCARRDQSRFADTAKNKRFYESTQTYGLPVVFEQYAESTEDVAQLAPEAGYLLTVAFPYLTLAEADAILTETEGPGGGFLDNGSAFGVYSRLDLYKAAERAIASRH
jgi:membrane-associated phospholipid phosphatase